MTTRLKNCPFCGNFPQADKIDIWCPNMDCHVLVTTRLPLLDRTRAASIRAWNTRSRERTNRDDVAEWTKEYCEATRAKPRKRKAGS
jgi:hypothetical protein